MQTAINKSKELEKLKSTEAKFLLRIKQSNDNPCKLAKLKSEVAALEAKIKSKRQRIETALEGADKNREEDHEDPIYVDVFKVYDAQQSYEMLARHLQCCTALLGWKSKEKQQIPLAHMNE